MKKNCVLALILALVLCLAACGPTTSTASPSTSPSESPAASDGESDSQVVAKVGDKEVLLEDLNNSFYNYATNMGVDISDPSNETAIAELRKELYELYISEMVQQVKCEELGLLELTAEEEETIQTYLDEIHESWRSYFETQAKSELPDATDEEIAQHTQELMDEYAETTGMTDEYIIEAQTYMLGYQKLYDQFTKDVTVSDEEVETYFNEQAAEQKELYDANAAEFENTYLSAPDSVYYVPENVRRVKHILISISEEDQTAIQEMETAGDEESAKARREEALAAIKDDAQAVLDSLEPDGSNFDTVMAEKSEDPGSSTYPDGYVVSAADSSGYDANFRAGAFALEKVGDISGLVESDFGYHIILFVEEMKPGTVELSSVQSSLQETLLTTKQGETFNELLTQWRAELVTEEHPELFGIEEESTTGGETASPSPSASASATTE